MCNDYKRYESFQFLNEIMKKAQKWSGQHKGYKPSVSTCPGVKVRCGRCGNPEIGCRAAGCRKDLVTE